MSNTTTRAFFKSGETKTESARKVPYAAGQCLEKGCRLGRACTLAHSTEEALYHPDAYKSETCGGQGACLGFYCPFAHEASELSSPGAEPSSAAPRAAAEPDCLGSQTVDRRRTMPPWASTAQAPEREGLADGADDPRIGPRQDRTGPGRRSASAHRRRRHRGGRRGARAGRAADLAAGEAPPAESDDSGADVPRWEASERLQVDIADDAHGAEGCLVDGDGALLLGGRLLWGRMRTADAAGGQSHRRCIVKLLPVCRDSRQVSYGVLAEVQRWADGLGPRRACAFRKTKATVCLASAPPASTLDRSVRALGGGVVGHLERDARLGLAASTWVGQLLAEVCGLQRRVGADHLCIAPRTVCVGAKGELFLGDFLGKAHVLRRLEGGGSGPQASVSDARWLMWYPAEVQAHRAAEAAKRPDVDLRRVDSWQLGVVAFYLLAGCHPFGDCRADPSGVCRNIQSGSPVNLGRLARLPLLADLVLRLTARDPSHRPLPAAVLEAHPLLWSPELRGSHLSNTTRLTQVFFKSDKSICKLW